MIYITEQDKDKINYNGWEKVERLDLSNGSYYAKYTGTDGAFRELFGKKIFDMVGIPSPDYLYIKDKNCILTTDLREKYKNFVFANELGDITSIDVLEEVLKQFTNYDELIKAINIMHFIDILFCNTDRHSSNYGFAINEDNSATLVVLDNELMLDDFTHATRPVSFPTNSHFTFLEYSKVAEYIYFLEKLPEDQKQIVYYLLKKFDIKTVYSIMTEIETEHKCKFKRKNKIFINYLKNYIKLYEVSARESKKQKPESETYQKVKNNN